MVAFGELLSTLENALKRIQPLHFIIVTTAVEAWELFNIKGMPVMITK